MEDDKFDENCELSDREDELDLTLHKDDLSEILVSDTETNSDSDDSDIIVHKKQRTQNTEITAEDNNEWVEITSNDTPFQTINFSTGQKKPGPQIANIEEPLQFFKLYFTDELVDEIILETNNYAKSKLQDKILSKDSTWHSWHDTNKEEFRAFLGVILNMGTMPLANMQEYWSTMENSRIPFFSNIFTRRRFNQIFWMLRLKTTDPQKTHIRTRIQRVSNFIECINDKFSQYFIPEKNICVGESVIKFNGKISFITCNPNKPTKYGIRIHVLADSKTGYVYNIFPYYGDVTPEEIIKPELPVGSRIPLHLYQKLLNNILNAQGYHIFTDRYYTSILLADELLQMKCHLTGIINRNELPNSIKTTIFSKSFACKRRKTMLLSWKGKKMVTLLSTDDSVGLVTRREEQDTQTPKIVMNYTTSMKGIDRADQYAGSYCFLRKSIKWWRKMFFWGMEMSVVNSYILYKSVNAGKNPLSHLKYVKRLVNQLVGDFRDERSRSSTSTSEIRLDKKLHIMRRGKKRDCVVCSNRKEKGKRHETNEFCDSCPGKPRMHMGDCFEKYHTRRYYK